MKVLPEERTRLTTGDTRCLGLGLGLGGGDAAVQLAQTRLLLDVGHLAPQQRGERPPLTVCRAALGLGDRLADQGGLLVQPAGDGPVEMSVKPGCSQ